MKKLRGTFGTIYNEMTNEAFVEVDDVAEELAKGWGNIPKYIGNRRAMEIHLLAKAYLSLLKKSHSNQGGGE